MSDTIKPLGDRVVAIREEAPTKTKSGLYLPDASQDKPIVAKVTAIGSDVKVVKVGDSILYKDYATTVVRMSETDYLIIREEDILATV